MTQLNDKRVTQEVFVSLPFASLDRLPLGNELRHLE
jgi:hypothetical protein